MTDIPDLIERLNEDAEYIATYDGFVGSRTRIVTTMLDAKNALARLTTPGEGMETTAEERAVKHPFGVTDPKSFVHRLLRDLARETARANINDVALGEWMASAMEAEKNARTWGLEAGIAEARAKAAEAALAAERERCANIAVKRAVFWRSQVTDAPDCSMSLEEECEDIAAAIRNPREDASAPAEPPDQADLDPP